MRISIWEFPECNQYVAVFSPEHLMAFSLRNKELERKIKIGGLSTFQPPPMKLLFLAKIIVYSLGFPMI